MKRPPGLLFALVALAMGSCSAAGIEAVPADLLADNLYRATWTGSAAPAGPLNYRMRQDVRGETEGQEVTLAVMVNDPTGRGAVVRVSYFVHDNKWRAFAFIHDLRRNARRGLVGPEDVRLRTEGRTDFCTAALPIEVDCYSWQGNVVVRTDIRFPKVPTFAAAFVEDRRLMAEARRHLRAVRSGTFATESPLPTVAPTPQKLEGG
jgi:hypothetical protein